MILCINIQNIRGFWYNVKMRFVGTSLLGWWFIEQLKREARMFLVLNKKSSWVPSWYIFFHRQESCLQRENFWFWILQGLGTGPFRLSTYYSQTGGLWGSQRYDHLSSEWFNLLFSWEWTFPSSEYCNEKRKKVSI